MRNGEHYPDPTVGQAMKKLRKVSVLDEKDLEKIDSHRYIPTLRGWSEAEEQEALIQWANAMSGRYPMLERLFHIPNGGSRHPAEGVHLKKMGVKAGVPDLFLPYPVGNYHGLWIEMKAEKGRPTALQKDWIEFLTSVGYFCSVCYGMKEAIDTIENYLRGET